jgi:hypothetical protein
MNHYPYSLKYYDRMLCSLAEAMALNRGRQEHEARLFYDEADRFLRLFVEREGRLPEVCIEVEDRFPGLFKGIHAV